MNKTRLAIITFFLAFITFLFSCKVDPSLVPSTSGTYKTKNVIIITIDGVRWSESWGDPTHSDIPHMANEMADSGCVFTHFYNEGITNTINGHAAILTGMYTNLANDGTESPFYPSVLQYWLKQTKSQQDQSWIISSKAKMTALSKCSDPAWTHDFDPMNNCGENGEGLINRADSTTFHVSMSLLEQDHPHLALIHFVESDLDAHAGNWQGYISSIKQDDEYAWEIWQFIQNDPIYKNSTALFVTTDHGRHLDGVANGWISHGDGCDGCRHIHCLALGPDFKKGCTVDDHYEQPDIAVTTAKLLGAFLPQVDGKVMTDILNK